MRMHFNKRKIIFIIILLLAIFGFKSCTKALTLGRPDSCANNIYDQTVCGSAGNGSYNDTDVYTGYRYLGNPGSTGTIYKTVNFIWDDWGVCDGEDITIAGQIWGYSGLFNENYTLDFYSGNRSLACNFTRVNQSRMTFACTGRGGGDLIMNFNLFNYSPIKTFTVAVDPVIVTTCDANNSTIVNSINTVNNNIGVVNESVNLVNESVNKTNDSVNRLNETMKSTDTTGAESEATDFFDDFTTTDQGGLSSIITAPLSLIQQLNTNTCTPLTLQIPFVNRTLTLPCLDPIYTEYFGTFYNVYQTIITGFIAYWVAIRLYAMIKGFKDPEDDKVEVLDL